MMINVESLTNQFINLIQDRIIDKEYKPGSQIPTKEIADEFNVSVMPIRQALRELADRGFVVNRARVGFFVADYSIEELLEISQTRRMFELYCLDYFFHSLNAEKFAEIRGNLEAMDMTDVLEYQKNDVMFHREIVLSSHNHFLIQQYYNIEGLLTFCVIFDSDPVGLARSKQEHIAMIDAILAADKADAMAKLAAHLDGVDADLNEEMSHRSR